MSEERRVSWEKWYEPPGFPLFEFDEPNCAPFDGHRSVRWFAGWNGQLGRPAESVELGWRNDKAALVVSSRRLQSGVRSAVEEARFNASFILTGVIFRGGSLSLPDLRRMTDELPTAHDLWTPCPVKVDGADLAGEVLSSGDCRCGYVIVDAVVASFAYRGTELAQMTLRTLTGGKSYGVDPLHPQRTPDAAQREWADLFADLPELDPKGYFL